MAAHLQLFGSQAAAARNPARAVSSCSIGSFPLKPQNPHGDGGGFITSLLNPLHFGVSAAPEAAGPKDNIQIVAHGKSFCGWSRKQDAAIKDCGVDNISYTSEKPEGCPNAPAYPCFYGVDGNGSCAVIKVGYQSINEEAVDTLKALAIDKLAP